MTVPDLILLYLFFGLRHVEILVQEILMSVNDVITFLKHKVQIPNETSNETICRNRRV